MITAKIPESEFQLTKLGTADLHGPISLEAHGLDPRGVVRWNYETPELQQHALRRGDGAFSKHSCCKNDACNNKKSNNTKDSI